jgi:hypothetical protein
MVHHLNESSGTHYDSTQYDIDGIWYDSNSQGDQNADGWIGGANEFDGIDDYVKLPRDTTVFSSIGNITLEAWVYLNDNPSSEYDIIAIGINSTPTSTNSRIAMEIGLTDELEVGGRAPDSQGTIQDEYTTTSPMSTGEWIHCVGIIDMPNDNVFIYINGENQATANTPDFTDTQTSSEPSTRAVIGSEDDGSDMFLKGILDELRISNVNRSTDWINASFNNQNDTSTFFYVGNEESSVTSGSTTYQWVELYNAGDSAIDLTGWTLSDNDGNSFNLTSAGSFTAGGYIICHLGESGTNSTTDIYGPPGNILGNSDDLELLNNQGSIIDYIAWGGDPGTDNDDAVTQMHQEIRTCPRIGKILQIARLTRSASIQAKSPWVHVTWMQVRN